MTAKKNALFQPAGFHDKRKPARSIGCFYIQPFMMPSSPYLRTEDFSLNAEGYRVLFEHVS